MPTVVITGVPITGGLLPGHEGQGGVAARHAGQAAPGAEDVHLDGLGRQAEQARDFLRALMLGDQAQDLALTRREFLETKAVGRLDHGAKMVLAQPLVQRSGVNSGRAKVNVQTDRTNGSLVVDWPHSASSALATAGAITGVPGSPTPLGGAADGTMLVSTLGASPIRSTR